MYHVLRTWAAKRLAAPLPQLLKAQSRHISIVDMANGKNTFQYSVTNLGDHNSVTNPMLFCIWNKSGIFDKVMGSFASIVQAWCRAVGACYRSQEPASGREWMIEIPKRMAGIDALNKHVEQISFRQCVTFCEHRQLKGWQPHFQPTVAKSSISTIVHWFAAVT